MELDAMCHLMNFESNAESDRLFRYSIEMLCITDKKGNIIKLNPAWENKLNHKTSELEGKSFFTLLHPEDIEKTRAALKEIEQGKEVAEYTIRCKHKNSEYYWLKCHTFLNNNYIYTSARDISETIQSGKDFLLPEELQGIILENIPDSIAFFKNNKCEWVNQTFLDFFECTKEMVKGKDLTILNISPDESKTIQEKAWSALTNEEIYYHELKITNKKNNNILLSLTCKALKPKNPEDGMLWIIRDISNPEKQLKEYEQNEIILHSTLKSLNDGLLIVDAQQKVLHYNFSLIRLFSVPDNDLYLRDEKSFLEYVKTKSKNQDEHVKGIEKNPSKDILELKDGKIIDCRSFPFFNKNEISGRIWIFRDLTEYRKKEETIRNKEKNYRLLFENMTSSFALHKVIFDSAGKPVDFIYVEVNPVFEKYAGLSADAVIGKSARELHPNMEDYWVNFFGEVAKTGNSKTIINYSKELDKYFEAYAFRTEKNYCAAIFNDVTDRIKSEEALRLSEKKYRLLFENMTSSFELYKIIYDKDGVPVDYQFLEVNPVSSKYTGFPASRIIGKTVKELFPKIENYWIKTFGEVAKTGNPVNYINYSTELDKYFEAFVFKTGKDQCASIFNDVTERVKNEEILNKFKASIDYSLNGVFWINKDAGFDYVNEQACKMLGYSCEELLKLKIYDIDPIATKEIFKTLWDRLNHNKKFEAFPTESRHKRKDGSEFPVELNSVFIWKENKGLFISYAKDISERKKYEEKILEKQKLLSEAQRIAQMGSWEIVLKDFSVHWSETMYLLHGLDKQNFKLNHENYLRMVHPDDRNTLVKNLKKIIETGKIDNDEYRIIRPDGIIITMISSIEVIRDENNQPVKLIGIVKNITESKKAEEALKASELKMKRIFEFAPISIGLLNKRIILDVNSQICNLTWYKKEELVGKKTEIVFPSKDEYERIGKIMYKELEENGFSELESKWKRKDGKLINVYLALTYLDPNEPSKGALFTAMDISKLKETEKHLLKAKEKAEESEFFLKESQRTGNIGSYKMNFESGYWLSTETLDKILGIDNSYNKSINGWLELVHPDNRQMITEYLHNILSQKQQPFDKEYRIIRKNDKKIRWVYVQGKIYFDADKNLTSMLGTLQDITERRLIEEERRMMNAELEKRVKERTARLQQVNNELESFAYSVSHDLRAPIRHIDGYFHLIERAVLPADPHLKNYFNKIYQSTRNMSVMIDELLKFARLGRTDINMLQVNLSVVINEIVNELKPDYEGRNIKWIISSLSSVIGDPRLLKIAFENLISNAIKYTSKVEHAIIEINEHKCTPEHVCIIIKDNGVGFDMTYKDKLFGVFQRLHKNEDYEGTGIGLANVKQIIEKHNGSIDAESEINKGATFYITLPV